MTKAFTVVKRVLAFILAALMILSIGISVFATENDEDAFQLPEDYDPDYYGSYQYKDGYGTEMDEYLNEIREEAAKENKGLPSDDNIPQHTEGDEYDSEEEVDYSAMENIEAPSIYDDGGNASELKPKTGVAVLCKYADNTNDEVKISTPEPDECLSAYTIIYDYKIDNGKWYSESGTKSNCILSSFAENYQGKGKYLTNTGIMLACMSDEDSFLSPFVNAVKIGTDEYNYTIYQFKPGIQVTVRYRYLLNTYEKLGDGSYAVTGSEFSQWSEPFTCSDSESYNTLPDSLEKPTVSGIEEVTVDGTRYAKVTVDIPESIREQNQGYSLSASNDVGIALKGQKKTGEDIWEDIVINDSANLNQDEYYIPLEDGETDEDYRFRFEIYSTENSTVSDWSNEKEENSKAVVYGVIAAVVILILSLSGIASVSLVKKCRAKASENSEEKESDNQSESATEEKE